MCASNHQLHKGCSFYEYFKKEQLQKDILEEEQKIASRKQYLSDILQHYHFSSDKDYENKKSQLQKQKDKITLYDADIRELLSENDSLETNYSLLLSDIPKEYRHQFQNAQMQIRKEYHSIATKGLQKHIDSPLELATYNRLAKEFDKLHNSSSTTKSTLPPEKKPSLPRHKR